MNLKKIFLLSIIPVVILFSVSCNKNQIQQTEYVYNSDFFDYSFNQEQLKYIIYNSNFFTVNNKKIDNLDKNKVNFIIQKKKNNFITYKNFNITNNNGFSDIDSFYDNSQFNINDLKNLYSKNYIKNLKKSKFPKSDFIPNIQIAIFDIYTNKKIFNKILPNWIDFDNIRFQGWKNNKEQIQYLEIALNFYFKAFKIKEFERFKINVLDDESIWIQMLDKLGNDIYKNYKQTKFVLPNFKNYNNKKTWPRQFDLDINEEIPFFNEIFKEPNLSFKKNPLLINSVEDLVEGNSLYKYTTTKGFASLLYNFKELTKITIPNLHFEQNFTIDLDKTLKLNNNLFLNSQTILPIFINENYSNFKWYSIDLNSHRHIFDGYYLENNLKFNFENKYTLANFKKFLNKNSNKMEFKSQLSLEEFTKVNLKKIISYFIYQNQNNKILWNGFSMKEFDAFNFLDNQYLNNPLRWIEILTTLVYNSFLFDFEDNNNLVPLNVKFKNIRTNNETAGSIIVDINIIDLKNKKIILETKNIFINGFKGFDYSKINEYLLQNSSISFENAPNFVI
ncbi:MAG3240 family lipoprotein [Mycoplasmopsis cricetuli]|uniref:MAG3240 family lipoprotein n=1 Tax=Mycoplasmopsis cricetuli TaxID=171283 RepID=UPI000471838B|nr:hypothetical protein [Mycoplasmopsis cricetuli]